MRRGAGAADLPGDAGFALEGADDFFGATGAGGTATLGAGAGGAASDVAGRVGGRGAGDATSGWVGSATALPVAGGGDGGDSVDLAAGVDVSEGAAIHEGPSVVAT